MTEIVFAKSMHMTDSSNVKILPLKEKIRQKKIDDFPNSTLFSPKVCLNLPMFYPY